MFNEEVNLKALERKIDKLLKWIDKNTPKTCPFCGGEPEMRSYNGIEKKYYYLSCIQCGARLEAKESTQEAIEAWNIRDFRYMDAQFNGIGKTAYGFKWEFYDK